jgi:pyrroline-5-carboxylate reductase
MRILIIGAGNMGKTYAKSLLSSYFTQPKELYILDKNPIIDSALLEIPEEQILKNPNGKISEADIIILAVKPQDFEELSLSIKEYIHPNQIILSIMAGIKISALANLNTNKIVRSMPNLPAQISMGMTVFTCTSDLDKKELFIIQNLLNTTGKSVYVDNETMIDAATAISGSGPAYVYYFMEAMINTAIDMGFSRAEAELMVSQTFMGAVHLHNQNKLTCSEWISKVASKGGTTEAALQAFSQKNLQQSIEAGLENALNRARELGK